MQFEIKDDINIPKYINPNYKMILPYAYISIRILNLNILI